MNSAGTETAIPSLTGGGKPNALIRRAAWHFFIVSISAFVAAFLRGDNPLTSRDDNHRKLWLEERPKTLAGLIDKDVLGFAILAIC